MPEESGKTIEEIQVALAEPKQDSSDMGANGIVETCPLCLHPSRSLLTQVYYERSKSVEEARQWFVDKFKRSFKEDTWRKHFKDHVEPFVSGYEIAKKRKFEDLMEKTAEAKREAKVSTVAVIKQMLFDFMIDAYVGKPDAIDTKESINSFSTMAKNLSMLSKSYKDFQQMEMDMMAYGKSEEEQKQVMKNYMTTMINNALRMFEGDADSQNKLCAVFGITNVDDKSTEVVDIVVE